MLYLNSIFPFGAYKGKTVKEIINISNAGRIFIKSLLPNLDFAPEVSEYIKIIESEIVEVKKEIPEPTFKKIPSPAKGIIDELKAKEKLKEAEDRILTNTSYQDLYSFLDTINVSYNNE